MTQKQKADLQIEWQVTSSKIKLEIREEYTKEYGAGGPQEHWEAYLVDALNLRAVWERSGLM